MISQRTNCIKGYTLIELLCVITIIGLLGAIIIVVLQNVRTRSHQTVCMNQMRQIGLAIKMYQSDYGEIPMALPHLYPAYVSNADVFRCPEWVNRYMSAPERDKKIASQMFSFYLYRPATCTLLHNEAPEPGDPPSLHYSWEEYLAAHEVNTRLMVCPAHDTGHIDEPLDLNRQVVYLDLWLDGSVHRSVSTYLQRMQMK